MLIYIHQALLLEARGTGQATNSHFLQRVKGGNVVVFHTQTHIFLITRWSCYHLTKENIKMTQEVGDSWC